MAKYMSATEFADYTASQFASPEDQPNISDFEDYDYDYESWIHYGDYWIKPDGSVSTEPPVVPPTEPTTPTPTEPKDKVQEDANWWDWSGNERLSEQDYWGGTSGSDSENTGGAFRDWYDTPANYFFRNRDGGLFDGNILYDPGKNFMSGMGVSTGGANKAGQLIGTILAGGLGGVVGSNVGPIMSDLFKDVMNQRTNEQIKDVIEDLNSTGYRSGRTAGSVLDLTSDWFGGDPNMSNVSPVNAATLQAALSLISSTPNSQWNSSQQNRDIRTVTEAIMKNQGQAYPGLSELPIERLLDYVQKFDEYQRAPNVTILPGSSPSAAVDYLFGPNSPYLYESNKWTAPAYFPGTEDTGSFWYDAEGLLNTTFEHESPVIKDALEYAQQLVRDQAQGGGNSNSGGGSKTASSSTGGGLKSGNDSGDHGGQSFSSDRPDKESGKSGGSKY